MIIVICNNNTNSKNDKRKGQARESLPLDAIKGNLLFLQ